MKDSKLTSVKVMNSLYKKFKFETVNTVYRTKDYSLFSLCIENRDIKRKHVEHLKETFIERQIPVPIVVDEYYRIHDGQHRYTACMELGIYMELKRTLKVNLGSLLLKYYMINFKEWELRHVVT